MKEDLPLQNISKKCKPPKMLKNLFLPEQCQKTIQFHKSHKHLTAVGDGSDYTGIRFMHIWNPEIRQWVFELIINLIGEIRKQDDQIVFPEMIAINEWPIGGIQHPHLDTYSNQQFETGQLEDKPSREWTCILYLNDDFRGGRTYIPEGDEVHAPQIFEPEVGSGLLFQGIYIPHGVEKVRRNSRHTISLWFTTDNNRCMPWFPVDDLNQNEDTFRLQDQQ